jgi:uncharacterized phage protein (TIGR02220 family)
MEYSFDIDFAKKYGVDEAIMIKSFQYWIRLNKANKSNFYDGHYWTYNTISALSELFPFWSEKQVRTILQNLLKLNILIKGNYNKFGFDRTIWYAFENEAEFLQINNSKKAKATSQIEKSILPNGQMELTKLSNVTSQMVNTIPITNTITNSITNTDKEKKEKKPSPSIKNISVEDLEYYQEFCQVLNYLSEKTDVKYNIPKDVATLKKYKNYILILEILKDGNDPDALMSVIDSKYNEWISDEKMCKYLVPSTLFRKSNFEKYLTQSQIKSVKTLKNELNNSEQQQEIRRKSVTNIVENALKSLNEQRQLRDSFMQSVLGNQEPK